MAFQRSAVLASRTAQSALSDPRSELAGPKERLLGPDPHEPQSGPKERPVLDGAPHRLASQVLVAQLGLVGGVRGPEDAAFSGPAGQLSGTFSEGGIAEQARNMVLGPFANRPHGSHRIGGMAEQGAQRGAHRAT